MKIFPATILLSVTLVGCVSGPPLGDYGLLVDHIELSDTPFFPQQRYQCGPAALATVLAADGVAVTPDELAPYVYMPERRGSLQTEMVAAARRHGRMPYILRPSLDDLLVEVAAGTPVLVMMNLGVTALPTWHYAVVIGYNVPSDSLLLRSGTDARHRMRRARFRSAWLRADSWAMVAVRPDAPSATADSSNWLLTASAFEELGQLGFAVQAYEVATRRWPEQPLAWQALANTRYALQDLPAAESALRRALQLAPSVGARNNLAQILHERGCAVEAIAQITLAEAMPGALAYAGVLKRTRTEIEYGSVTQSKVCSAVYEDEVSQVRISK